MVRKSLSVGIFGFLVAFATSGNAEHVEWPVDQGGNGHFYETRLRLEGIGWNRALSQCVADGGYLVTITSAAENAFVFDLVSGDRGFWYLDAYNNGIGPWLGGYQPEGSEEPAGNWR